MPVTPITLDGMRRNHGPFRSHTRQLFVFFLPTANDELPPIHLLPSSPLPSPPFRSRPLNTAIRSGERCMLPQWGLRRSASRQTIWCILESESAALVTAVFVDFPKNECNILYKNKLDIVRRVQFLTGRHPMRSHAVAPQHCPMEVGAYGSPRSNRLCTPCRVHRANAANCYRRGSDVVHMLGTPMTCTKRLNRSCWRTPATPGECD